MGLHFMKTNDNEDLHCLLILDTMSSYAFEHNGKGISLCKLFHVWKA
jgi:hypothetical protein